MEPTELLKEVLYSAANQQFDLAEHNLCKAYYYGYQETDELRALRAQLHKPTHTPNLFNKYVNTVLGMEEQQRVDIMVAADDDGEEDEAVAEALNKRMAEVCRLHDVNHHTAEAFLPMANAGLAWVYWGRNTDVLGLPYDCHYVPESEILWDRRSRRLDLSDCQYMARRRFLAENECIGLFSEHKALIKRTYASSTDWGPISLSSGVQYCDVDMSQYSEHMVRDSGRHMVAVLDVYYRSYEQREVLFYEDGRRMVYDKENPIHIQDKMRKGVPCVKRMVKVMRNAWYIGPYLISDEISPHPHSFFPYVLFRGNQEEDTGACFAVGRSLIPPQDAYNSAHVQQHYLMEKVTVLVKRGSLTGTQNETLEDLQIEAHKADGVIELNSMDDVQIMHHYEQIQHLSVMKQDAERAMEAASGISNSLTGEKNQNKSGIAQQVQVEQATVTMSDLFSNYYFGRTMLGRLILAHIIDDIGMSQQEVNIKSETGEILKTVVLNQPGDDGQLTNVVPMARTRVVLDDIESSRGYRAQNMFMLQQTAGQAPDEIKPYLYLGILKLSNMPQRHELISDLQKKLGKGTTEEEQQQMDQAAAQQAQEMFDLEKREREAKIDLDKANATLAIARAGRESQQVQADMEGIKQGEAANDSEVAKRKREKVVQMREVMAQRALA